MSPYGSSRFVLSRVLALATMLSATGPALASDSAGKDNTAAYAASDAAVPSDPQRRELRAAKRELITLYVGQAQLLYLPFAARRVAVADDGIADYRMMSPSELYILGKSVGKTNLLVWPLGGGAPQLAEVTTTLDLEPLVREVRESMPDERAIEFGLSGSSIVLRGMASNTLAADAAMRLAEAYAVNLNQQLGRRAGQQSGKGAGFAGAPAADVPTGAEDTGDAAVGLVRVINLMKIRDPQQVMLEVRIAEVSRSLVEKLGVAVGLGNPGGDVSWNLSSGFLGGGGALGSLLFSSNGTTLGVDVDAERKRGVVNILAEPTIVALSGSEGNFLVGGRIFIPVSSSGSGSNASVTLEERDFGVSLKFIPTVLDGGRISLKVAPEVSEISKEPLQFSNGATTSLLPAFTTSRVSTTVQLQQGQSLVIGGLIKNNLTKTSRGVPLLSQIPVLGALFRSKDFATDKTELVVVVRPTLVAATDTAPRLPLAAKDGTPTGDAARAAYDAQRLNPDETSRPVTAREVRPALDRAVKATPGYVDVAPPAAGQPAGR